MENVIAYARSQTDFAVDADQIILLGHSFGTDAVIGALNERCGLPFCVGPTPQPITVPLDPGIKVVVLFGSSLYQRRTGVDDTDRDGDWIDDNNNGFDVLIFNGSGDENTFQVDVDTQ